MKRCRFDHSQKQGGKPPPFPIQPVHDLVHRLDVMIIQPAPQGVSEQFFSDAAVKIGLVPLLEDALQLAHVVERLTGEQLARCIDRLPALLVAPEPQGVEILEGQAQRVHPRMARAAQGLGAMQGQQLAARRLPALEFLLRLFEGRTSAGGGGAGVPRKFSRMNWPRFTGEVRVGFEVTSKIEACVSTPPRGLSLGSETLLHLVPGHALDPIKLGQLGVQEGVIAVDQFEHAAIFAARCRRRASRSRGASPGASGHRARSAPGCRPASARPAC